MADPQVPPAGLAGQIALAIRHIDEQIVRWRHNPKASKDADVREPAADFSAADSAIADRVLSGRQGAASPGIRIMLDVNVWLDLARLLGNSLTTQTIRQVLADPEHDKPTVPRRREIDSLRLWSMLWSGKYAGSIPVVLCTGRHIVSEVVANLRRWGWTAVETEDFLQKMVLSLPSVYLSDRGDRIHEATLGPEDAVVGEVGVELGVHVVACRDHRFNNMVRALDVGDIRYAYPTEIVTAIAETRRVLDCPARRYPTSRVRAAQRGLRRGVLANNSADQVATLGDMVVSRLAPDHPESMSVIAEKVVPRVTGGASFGEIRAILARTDNILMNPPSVTGYRRRLARVRPSRPPRGAVWRTVY